MKCPLCGAYNKPEYKKCFRCGTDLADEQLEHSRHSSPESDQSGIWTHKPQRQKQPFYIKRTSPQESLVAIDDEAAADDVAEKKESVNIQKIRRLKQGQTVNVIVPKKKEKKAPKIRKRGGIRWFRLVMSLVVISAVLGGLVVGFIYAFRGVSSGISNLFDDRNELPNGGVPLVERVMIDGQTWHKITFFGQDGERILVENPIRSLTVYNGKAELLIDDNSYIPDSTDENYGTELITVKIKASRFSLNGEETVLDVPDYNIEVPLSPLKLISPAEQGAVVDYSQVFVKVKILPGSRIFIGSKNLTDMVDSEGYVSTYINLDPTIGDNVIPISVETENHRMNRYDLTVNRPILDPIIVLTDPPSERDYSEVILEGKTEPGATLTTNVKQYTADLSVDADGNFRFGAKLNAFGTNEITITATTTDGRTSSLTHYIERKPAHREYTMMAWPIDDYDYLVSATEHLIGRVYKCTGFAVKKEETEDASLYLYDIGGGTQKYIYLQYSGQYDFQLNVTYDIYADVIGSYKNYPLLIARFIYDHTEPESTANTGG